MSPTSRRFKSSGGGLPSAGADGPLPFCSSQLNLICSCSLSDFSVGRLPRFEQTPTAHELEALRGGEAEERRRRSRKIDFRP